MFSNRTISTFCAALIALVASAAIARADQVDNPRYKAWSSFKVESSETVTGTMTMGPIQATVEMKMTLKEVTDDHVIVETVRKMTFNGNDRENPPTRTTIQAKADAKDVKELDPEDVEAMGKTFKCKVMSVTNDITAKDPSAQGSTAQMKIWANHDVPGGLIKLETTMQRPGAAAQTVITFLLKDYEAK